MEIASNIITKIVPRKNYNSVAKELGTKYTLQEAIVRLKESNPELINKANWDKLKSCKDLQYATLALVTAIPSIPINHENFEKISENPDLKKSIAILWRTKPDELTSETLDVIKESGDLQKVLICLWGKFPDILYDTEIEDLAAISENKELVDALLLTLSNKNSHSKESFFRELIKNTIKSGSNSDNTENKSTIPSKSQSTLQLPEALKNCQCLKTLDLNQTGYIKYILNHPEEFENNYKILSKFNLIKKENVEKVLEKPHIFEINCRRLRKVDLLNKEYIEKSLDNLEAFDKNYTHLEQLNLTGEKHIATILNTPTMFEENHQRLQNLGLIQKPHVKVLLENLKNFDKNYQRLDSLGIVQKDYLEILLMHPEEFEWHYSALKNPENPSDVKEMLDTFHTRFSVLSEVKNRFNFCEKYKTLSKEKRIIYFEALKYRLPETKITGDLYDFSVIYALFRESQHDTAEEFYFNTMKERLFENTINYTAFEIVYRYLSPEYKKEYFNSVKGKLIQFSKKSPYAFSEIYEVLSAEDKAIFLGELKDNFIEITKSTENFMAIYSATKKNYDYLCSVKHWLPRITATLENFAQIYKSLPKKEAEDYLKVMEGLPPSMTEDPLSFAKIYSLLPNENKPDYLKGVKHKFFNCIRDNKTYHFNGVSYCGYPDIEDGNHLTVMRDVVSMLKK